jgi:cytochrome c-type biogenesis protein CcmH/NrfF
MLKEIDTHIAAGLNDQQVLDAMIKQYGPLAYVEPPKSGFGLVAWLMPILYLLGGLALVFVVMKRWRKRPAAVASAAGANGVHVSPELLARARAQAQRETEE